MLPKIRIIPKKKASDKSFSASNFVQKSLPDHMSISPRVEPGGSKDDMVEILNCTETENTFTLSTISSFEPPSSTPGGGSHMPSWTFLSEIRCRKTFIWNFLWNNAYFRQRSAQKWMQFSVSVQFNIWTISSFEPPNSTLGGRGEDICPHGLFCPKFDAEKLLFKAFFGINTQKL